MNANLIRLVDELRKLSRETSWVEFKRENYRPDMIGEDISALANAAASVGRSCAYMVWGIHDETHEVCGTKEDIRLLRVGNEELENWLRHNLSDNADFDFACVDYAADVRVNVLKIRPATSFPVAFKKDSFIRVGSYTKKLRDYKEVEARLWDRLRDINFESQQSLSDLTLLEALGKLDLDVYFEKTKTPMPSTIEELGRLMCVEKVLYRQDNGLYAITNMGGTLFARALSEFPRIARKAVRVIQYTGENRMHMMREYTGTKGYAVGLDGLIDYLQAMTPADASIVGAFRDAKYAYPKVALRELVANALVHQDFSIRGAGPLIEVFSNRVEITNPGECKIELDRIIDSPPWSRNEDLAALMRRMRMCEEAGGGWDKAILSCEEQFLPAPRIENYKMATKVSLCSAECFADMTLEDRLWACYTHACILFLDRKHLTSSSVKKRFGAETIAASTVSKLLKKAVERGYIRVFDPNVGDRAVSYVPYWA